MNEYLLLKKKCARSDSFKELFGDIVLTINNVFNTDRENDDMMCWNGI